MQNRNNEQGIPNIVWTAIALLLLSFIAFGIYDRANERRQERQIQQAFINTSNIINSWFKPKQIENKPKVIYIKEKRKKATINFSWKETKEKQF
jgi:type III secretory pathway component EscR